jgi:hypothetical protein
MKHCAHCHGPLIEIDHYGERLVGCIDEAGAHGHEASLGGQIYPAAAARRGCRS